MNELTTGSIQALYQNNKQSPLTRHPLVQVIWIRSVPSNGKTRYRALVSDGVHYMQAMLAIQYAPVIEQGKIKKYTIVKLKETVLNEGESFKMLIVLGLDVVTVHVDSQIGNPVKLEASSNPSSPVPSSVNGRSTSASFQSLPQSVPQSQPQSQSQSLTQSQPKSQPQSQPQNYSQYLTQSQPQGLSQRLPPTQPIDSYTPSQSSWSSQTYQAKVKPEPYTQRPPYPSHGLSVPYAGQPKSMNSMPVHKSPMPSSNNGNISLLSSSQQLPIHSSQKSSMNLFSSASQPVRKLPPSAPIRVPAPFMKISELNPYVKSWTLRARVSLKTPIRTWNNIRSRGKLFNIIFVDETGEIGATAFNDQVTRLYDFLQEGQVYSISKAKITMNNRRFSNVTSDYELHLESVCEVKLCPDDPTIPYMKLNLVKLSDIDTYPIHGIIDVMGIVVEDRGMFEVVKKSWGGGKLVHKREVMVVDQSLQKVRFTLWDDEARDFDTTDNPVLVCKGARVATYQGAYLSTSPNTTIKRNPLYPEAKKLKEWYDSVGHCMDYQTFQAIGPDEFSHKLPKVTIADAVSESFGSVDKPEYFVVKATITYIKPDNGIYAGCPNCKKKLFLNEGQWYCERCEKVYEYPVWKFILTISIDDENGQLFVNMFDELTSKVLGITAEQFVTLKQTDESAADNLIHSVLFQSYNFKIRARTEQYNGMERLKYQIVEMSKVNFIRESKSLVNDIFSLLY